MAYNDNIIKALRESFKKDESDRFTNCALVFAYNGTGKTRLSYDFAHYGRKENAPQHTLYYNAYTEDLFTWDNDFENNTEHHLLINQNSSLIQGLAGSAFSVKLRKYLHVFVDIDFEFHYQEDGGEIPDYVVFSKKLKQRVKINGVWNEVEDEIENIKTDIETEVVTKNPLADAYTDMYGSVKIKNETSYTLSDDILNSESLNINGKNVLIFHTHTCESYTSSDAYSYTATGSYRTTDLNYTVARVGDELETYLNSYGFNVNHDKTYHDYPAYTGSYSRSLATVQTILKEEKDDVIIDLHRDAIGSRPDYAPTVRIGDEYAAQIMFVIGSNGGGLYHPNWSSNLKFAVKVQEKANEMYPGLFKPIIFRNSRYNQHLGKAACIIEVGSTGNTLEQTLVSMKYLSTVLNEVMSE